MPRKKTRKVVAKKTAQKNSTNQDSGSEFKEFITTSEYNDKTDVSENVSEGEINETSSSIDISIETNEANHRNEEKDGGASNENELHQDDNENNKETVENSKYKDKKFEVDDIKLNKTTFSQNEGDSKCNIKIIKKDTDEKLAEEITKTESSEHVPIEDESSTNKYILLHSEEDTGETKAPHHEIDTAVQEDLLNSPDKNDSSQKSSIIDEQPSDTIEIGDGENKGFLMVTWKNKTVKVPCLTESQKDIKYYSRQLNIIAYPIVVSDLFDSELSQALSNASEVSMKVEKGVGDTIGMGYLRLKFKIHPHVEQATLALKNLPPLPEIINAYDEDASKEEAGRESFDEVKTEKQESVCEDESKFKEGVEENNLKEPNDEPKIEIENDAGTEIVEKESTKPGNDSEQTEATNRVDAEPLDKEKQLKNDDEKKEENKHEVRLNEEEKEEAKRESIEQENKGVKNGKRVINIRRFLDYDDENDTMNTVKRSMHFYKFSFHKVLLVSNLVPEVSEQDIAEEFEGCERVIIPLDNKQPRGYAYVDFVRLDTAKKSLEKFKSSSIKASEWFVLPAISESSDYFGLLSEKERQTQLADIKSLEGVFQGEEDEDNKKSIEKKIIRFKKRLMVDNIKRQKLGLYVSSNEIFESVLDDLKLSEETGTRYRGPSRRDARENITGRLNKFYRRPEPPMERDYSEDHYYRGPHEMRSTYYRGERSYYPQGRRNYDSVAPLMTTPTYPYSSRSSSRYQYSSSAQPRGGYSKSSYTSSSYKPSYSKPTYHRSEPDHRYESNKTPSYKYSEAGVSKDPHLMGQLKDLIESLPSDKIKEINDLVKEDDAYSRDYKSSSHKKDYQSRRVDYSSQDFENRRSGTTDRYKEMKRRKRDYDVDDLFDNRATSGVERYKKRKHDDYDSFIY